MLALMFLVGLFLVVGVAVGLLALLVKLVLLPIKLALGLFKLAVAGTVGLVLLLLGLPILLILALPLALVGFFVWGVARLAVA